MKNIPRKHEIDHTAMKTQTGRYLDGPHYRAMLAYISIGDSVIARHTEQYGTVEQILRDKNGIPVCFKVRYFVHDCDTGEPTAFGLDYIPADRVTSFEITDMADEPSTYNEFDYAEPERMMELLPNMGYRFDKNEYCWINDETGDVICW